MQDITKIGLLGGDARMRYAAEILSRETECAVWGTDGELPPGTVRSADWQGAVRGAEAVVLPLPASRDGETLSAPAAGETLSLDSILDAMPAGSALFGGKLPPLLRSCGRERGVAVYDYYEDETFQIANAVPTAEGAVAACIDVLPGTVAGLGTVVVGYGRVGRTLANRLRALGARVTVAARSDRDRAWAAADGCLPVDLAEYRIRPCPAEAVFNTVPVRLFEKDLLEALAPGTVLFELADGVDRVAAEGAGVPVVLLPGLPGKVAPKTAGEIIAASVSRILAEGGRRHG